MIDVLVTIEIMSRDNKVHSIPTPPPPYVYPNTDPPPYTAGSLLSENSAKRETLERDGGLYEEEGQCCLRGACTYTGFFTGVILVLFLLITALFMYSFATRSK